MMKPDLLFSASSDSPSIQGGRGKSTRVHGIRQRHDCFSLSGKSYNSPVFSARTVSPSNLIYLTLYTRVFAHDSSHLIWSSTANYHMFNLHSTSVLCIPSNGQKSLDLYSHRSSHGRIASVTCNTWIVLLTIATPAS